MCSSFACFRCFHSCFVHAPFPCFLFALRSALPWSSAPCPALTLFVLLSVSLVGLLSLACVALRGACDCVVLCSCWCFSLSSWFLLRSSLCLGGPCCFCCCLPSFGLVPFSVLFAFPPPRVVSCGALVQLVPWRAGASLWVSGCSCDGSVALLSCWECGCALSSFRQLSHGSKG